MIDFRMKGLEDIHFDLKEYSGWDGESKVASVILKLGPNGEITQTIYLGSFSDMKRIEAFTIFGKDYIWGYINSAPNIKELKSRLPSMSYIVNLREVEEEEDLVLPSSQAVKEVYRRLFTDTTATHKTQDKTRLSH